MHSHVSLLTDYGLADEFVGVVKCVITDGAPHVRITDITHGVPSFDVRAGSLALARAVPYVPEGIIMAVVDPGVGSARRALAIEVAGGRGVFLGPDNGLLPSAVAMAGGPDRVFVLDNTDLHLESHGATFAGRDVFAPVAAYLANGGDIEQVGTAIDASTVMPGLVPVATTETREPHGEGLRCEVTWVDTFGNCQLNIGPDEAAHLGPVLRIVLDDDVRSARVCTHYAEIGQGAVGAVVDSYGMLALSVDSGSAAAELRLQAGDAVFIAAGDTAVTASVSIRRPL